MLHIVLIDESFPLNTRNRKILDSFAESFKDKAELSVITWDRKRILSTRLSYSSRGMNGERGTTWNPTKSSATDGLTP